MPASDKVAEDVFRQVQLAIRGFFQKEAHDQKITTEWMSPQVLLLKCHRFGRDRKFSVTVRELKP